MAEATPPQPPAPEEEPPADPSSAVAVAYVHHNSVSYSWHHSMVELLGWDWMNQARILRGGYVAIRYGTDGLPEARNMAVREFLASDRADWMWWIDCDMGFTADTVDRLFVAADPVQRPIVGGLCFSYREVEPDQKGGWRGLITPTIFDWAIVPGAEGAGEQQGFAVRWDYAENAVQRCGGTGSACLLIHRSVFERVAERYGPIWYDRVPNTTTGQLISEDLSFCLRAGALGIPLYVHTGVRTTHEKTFWLAEDDYARQRAFESPAESRDRAQASAQSQAVAKGGR